MRTAVKGFLIFLVAVAFATINLWVHFAYVNDRDATTGGDEEHTNSTTFAIYELPKSDDVIAFEEFEAFYNKKYESEEARLKAFTVFEDNLRYIETHNSNPKATSTLGVNQFADLHTEQFKQLHLGLAIPAGYKFKSSLPTFMATEGLELPKSIDWVNQGAVTPVKNQGMCGSCWSFSTTGALEGRWKVLTNTLTSLSEQQFVDCDEKDHGCNGGLMDDAFFFAENNNLCSEESYPYDAKDETCKEDQCKVSIGKGSVVGFRDVDPQNEQAMKEALNGGPVSVAIEADMKVFQLYQSGVISGDDCGSNLDHGVLAVGYGEEGGKTFWKVKNSWGAQWGDSGYVKISREMNEDGSSTCGILSLPSFPEMKKTSDLDWNLFKQAEREVNIEYI